MTPERLAARFRELEEYVGWTAADAERVQALLPLARPHFGPLIDDFYAEILRHPAAASVITGGAEQVARLKLTLVGWLEQLFAGPFDGQYLDRRWKVGLRHAEIGLDQVYTNAALSRLRVGLIDALASSPAGGGDWVAVLKSLMRRIDLDLAIIEDAYQFQSRARQQQAVTDLGYYALDSVSTDTFLEKVTEVVASTLKAAYCQIWEASPGGTDLVLRAGQVSQVSPTRCASHPSPDLSACIGQLDSGNSWRESAAQAQWRATADGRAEIELVIPGHRAAFGLLILGTERPLPLSRSDRNFLESIVNIVATAIDRRRAEERSLQAERLAAIGQVATGLAHESRNALQRSLACLDLLALEVEDRPEALDLVRRTQRAQSDLHQLYEEVRSYAAPIVLDRRRCQLPELWREAWKMLAQTPGWKAGEIVEEISSEAETQLVADPFRLTQIFRNILENSLAATSEPLRVEISVSRTHLGGVQAVSVSIHDNGPGLSLEQRKRVFEPFYTTKTQGTGLGMAIARRIVEAHGGLLQVGPSRYRGAEFVIVLPCEAEATH